MAVYQIRGTSGSGKSTIARNLLSKYEWRGVRCDPKIALSRKSDPTHYELVDNPGIIILGSYRSECGGCDSLVDPSKLPKRTTFGSSGLCRAISGLLDSGYKTIICESLILSEDVKWTITLPDVSCLFLTTPLEVCYQRIQARRDSRNGGKSESIHTTRVIGHNKVMSAALKCEKRAKAIEKIRLRLLDLGIDCRRVGSSQALKLLSGILDTTINQR